MLQAVQKNPGDVAHMQVIALEVGFEQNHRPVMDGAMDEIVDQQVAPHAGRHAKHGGEPEGDRLAYVDASSGEQEFLAVYRVEDGVSEIVCPVEGHVVMSWSGDGRTLAISQALGESPHVFTGVTLVDVRSGSLRVVHDSDVVSFF